MNIGIKTNNVKNTPRINILYSSLNKKLGNAISIALAVADPSGFPNSYQFLYLVASVRVS